jgi:hypothetical protein
MLVRSAAATKKDSVSTLPTKVSKKEENSASSGKGAKRLKTEVDEISTAAAAAPIDNAEDQQEASESEMGQEATPVAATHKSLVALAKAYHEGDHTKMLSLFRHFSTTAPSLHDTPPGEKAFRSTLIVFKEKDGKAAKNLWGDLLRIQKGLIKASIASSSSSTTPTTTNTSSSSSSSSSSTPPPSSIQDVYKDKDLKKKLSKVLKAVTRDKSLQKNLFEENREAKVTDENGKGAGDAVFKNSLTVRVVDEAKELIKAKLKEVSSSLMDTSSSTPSEDVRKRKRPFNSSSSSSSSWSRKAPPTIADLKTLKIKSKAAVAATIATETNPAVLKAAAIVLAAKRRKAYRET